MSILRSQALLSCGVLGLSLLTAACDDDEGPGTLFDEEGVWSVVNYDLDGSGDLKEIDTMNRRDAFMLSFDPENRVVTTAACGETENDTPANSGCLLTPDTTSWFCSCYGYDFVEDQMLWREFDAGDIPPELSLDDVVVGEDGTTDAELGTVIQLGPIEGVSSTFNYLPLPDGLFGSNGENSRYIFQARSAAVFARAYEDEVRDTCEPCVPDAEAM